MSVYKEKLLTNPFEYFYSYMPLIPSLIFIALGLIVGFLKKNKWKLASLVGVSLFTLYIIYINSYDMWGYWLITLGCVSFFNIISCFSHFQWKHTSQQNLIKCFFCVWFIISLIGPSVRFSRNIRISQLGRLGPMGVVNERLFYFDQYGLLSKTRKWPTPSLPINTKPSKATKPNNLLGVNRFYTTAYILDR